MILNRQTKTKVDLREAAALVRRLEKVLGLEGRKFNVCFVNDDQIGALNGAHRNKPQATDVLSFPWQPGGTLDKQKAAAASDPAGEFTGFLGDVVISVETARRNAAAEGHRPATEISWLILHGVLHLLGMDHETDSGEMLALERGLRDRLGLNEKASAAAGDPKRAPKRPTSRSPKPASKILGC